MTSPSFRSVPPAGMHLPLGRILGALGDWLSASDAPQALREAVQRTFGVRHAFLYSSGKAALSVGLMALGRLHPERDEVLIPAFTSYSVPSAVVRAGFKVSLYDIDHRTLSPDLESLKRAFTDKSLCAVVCHLFGIPCDMGPLRNACQDRGVPVLDDAAQAMGASCGDDGLAGTLGDLGLYSLGRGKNITGVNGGILVTDSDALAQAISAIAVPEATGTDGLRAVLSALAMHLLMRPGLYWIPRSLPFLGLGKTVFDPDFPITGLGSFQAALGRRMLVELGQTNSQRRDKARDMLFRLGERRGNLVLDIPANREPVYPRLPLMAGSALADRLRDHGVARSFPQSLDRVAPLKNHTASAADCPGARRLATELITVPTHSYFTSKDMDAIADALRGAGKGSPS